MKKILLSIVTGLAAMYSVSAYAQATTFATNATSSAYPNADTVYFQVQQASVSVPDYIMSTQSSGTTIKWKVIASNFPTDWLASSALGICDNNLCYVNTNNAVWNASTHTGSTFTSSLYHQLTAGDFHLALSFTGTTSVGQYYMTVQLTDANNASSTKTVTFLIAQYTTGIQNINKSEDDISLYPNPANNEVNVVYSPDANVKTICIYNLIGSVVKVFYPQSSGSGKLNIENLPAGIYILRLTDTQGSIVGTRKFTKR